MKKLLFILCLFSINAHAEWKSLVCEFTSESNREQFLTIQFDETLQLVIAGKIW